MSFIYIISGILHQVKFKMMKLCLTPFLISHDMHTFCIVHISHSLNSSLEYKPPLERRKFIEKWLLNYFSFAPTRQPWDKVISEEPKPPCPQCMTINQAIAIGIVSRAMWVCQKHTALKPGGLHLSTLRQALESLHLMKCPWARTECLISSRTLIFGGFVQCNLKKYSCRDESIFTHWMLGWMGCHRPQWASLFSVISGVQQFGVQTSVRQKAIS